MNEWFNFPLCLLWTLHPCSWGASSPSVPLVSVQAASLLCFFPLVASLMLSPLCYWIHQGTSDLWELFESCLALTLKVLHASFAVPLLEYFRQSLTQTAVASICVGPFLGDLKIPGASGPGNTVLLIFSNVTLAGIVAFGSSMGFKYQAGTLSWTSGCTPAFSTNSNDSLSVILPNDEMWTYAVLAWACALKRWSKVEMISAHSSSFLFFSGSCHRNSQPVGTSLLGSCTSTPLVVRCCLRWGKAGSFIALITVSISTSFICSQWCSMSFFSLRIVEGRASLLSFEVTLPNLQTSGSPSLNTLQPAPGFVVQLMVSHPLDHQGL